MNSLSEIFTSAFLILAMSSPALFTTPEGPSSSSETPNLAVNDDTKSVAELLQNICNRLDAIERRLDKLEGRKAEQIAKPILQIQVAKYGSPQSDALMDDIRRLSDMDHPVKFEFVRFGNTAPAFRWTDEDGNTVTRQGYKAGTLHKIIESIIGRPYPVDYAGPMFGNG